VAAARWFRVTYLAHFSRPKSARQLFRLIKRQRICRIVEIGISDVSRTRDMIEVAQRYATQSTIFHTGLDWFDARSNELERLSLKDAYRMLHGAGACVRLVPGCPEKSLAAVANAHQNTDLLLVSSMVSDVDLDAAWFYVPRMLHAESLILRERKQENGDPTFEPLSRMHVAEWAGRSGFRRAA
jgi:hypothetical protein